MMGSQEDPIWGTEEDGSEGLEGSRGRLSHLLERINNDFSPHHDSQVLTNHGMLEPIFISVVPCNLGSQNFKLLFILYFVAAFSGRVCPCCCSSMVPHHGCLPDRTPTHHITNGTPGDGTAWNGAPWDGTPQNGAPWNGTPWNGAAAPRHGWSRRRPNAASRDGCRFRSCWRAAQELLFTAGITYQFSSQNLTQEY